MNKKLFAIITVVTLLFSFVIYKLYNGEDKNLIYLMQVGAYRNYDNAIKLSEDLDNYFILKEDDLYKIYIGLTKSDEVYNKLVNLYASNISSYKKILNIYDEELDYKITKYDELLSKTNNKEDIDLIMKEEVKMINEYIGEV